MTIIRTTAAVLIAISFPLAAIIIWAQYTPMLILDAQRLAPTLAFLGGLSIAAAMSSMVLERVHGESGWPQVRRVGLLSVGFLLLGAALWYDLRPTQSESVPIPAAALSTSSNSPRV